MVTKDFDQANALINRLMEGVGGSANAYDEPVPDPETKQDAPEPEKDEDTSVFNDPEGVDIDGEAVWDHRDRSWWTNPPPVTDEYEPAGVVGEAEELKAIYHAICMSLKDEEPQEVPLETGAVQTELYHGDTWIVKDEVKDRLYCQERPACYDAVNEDDVFIWVMMISDPDADLGYIHEGYVFLRK